MTPRRTGTVSRGSASTDGILLLVSKERNQDLLSDRLGDTFSVETDPAALEVEGAVDLVILDGQSFRQHADAVETRVRDAEPTFLPVLFLSRSPETERLPDEVWSLVDDVVSLPIGPRELDARVSSLLRQRTLSLELTRRKERSERRFAALFDATPDPVAVVTPDGTVRHVNPAFERTYDIDADAIQGRSITDLDFESADHVRRLLLRIVDAPLDGNADTIEWTDADGDSLFTELNASVVSELDAASERIGIFRDVTERVTHRRNLETQNDRLEEFAGTITHDLRNPLNIARGHLELGRQTGDDSHFDRVEDAHGRMQQLIEEVLSLAQQGTVVIDPEPVTLEDAAGAAWRNVETADATLAVDLDGDLRVSTDRGRLESLFENLFRNSVEHGGDEVRVRVRVDETPGGFFVADDGPGIPAAQRESVFEPGVSSNDDGTGFGLAIVDQVAGAHGWTITVGASESGGARFDVTGVDRV